MIGDDMDDLLRHDLNFVLSRVPKDVREMLQEEKSRPMFLAGGFIRATIAGERVNDIDLFGDSKERLEAQAKDLALARKGRLHATDNAFTVLAPPRKPVQFIHRWLFNDALSCCESFDFTIAQAVIGFDGSKWQSVISERFYPDLAARRLYYTAPVRNEDAGGSILRARKFLTAGYTIQAPSLGAVIARLMTGVNESEMAMSGEEGLAQVITGLLREVDPLIVVDGVDLVDEHQVIAAEENQQGTA